MKDYYKVLGISKNSSSDDIKRAYRKLAKEYHPDRNQGNKDAEEMFKNVSEAYNVLIDEKLKSKFDSKLNEAENKSKNFKNKSTTTQTTTSNEFNFENLEKSFESFFGFNPKSNDGNLKKPQSKNPLDTTEMFNNFFKL